MSDSDQVDSSTTARPRTLRVALSWLPALLYTALIWVLSSQSISFEGMDQVPLRDKGLHFMEYAGLGLCICFAVYTTWPGRGIRAGLAAVLITTGLGLSDELHQAFVPERSADVLDLVADFAGAIFAALVYHPIQLLRSRRVAAPPPAAPPPAAPPPAAPGAPTQA
jgi:VanZ family protein